MSQPLPVSTIDLFTDETLRSPWEAYAELRAAGPAVWMEKGAFVAVSRYEDVRAVLRDDRTFISGEGVALNDIANGQMKGTIIAADGEPHEVLRRVTSQSLSPRALRALGVEVQAQANDLIEDLVARGSFECVSALSRRFPMTIVLHLIGVDDEGREKVLEWADNSFNLFGPLTAQRTIDALQNIAGIFDYAERATRSGALRPGSMGSAIHDAVASGAIRGDQAPGLLVAYLTGGLDTTISSISQAVLLLADNPEQWSKLRADPTKIPGAYNEILRLQSPAHWFSRYAAEDTVIGETAIAKGMRIVPLLASANRDERKWTDPEAFDIDRAPVDHVAFGYGPHGCAGQALARLEVHALLTALAARVARIEVGPPIYGVNNIIHGLARLDTTLHA